MPRSIGSCPGLGAGTFVVTCLFRVCSDSQSIIRSKVPQQIDSMWVTVNLRRMLVKRLTWPRRRPYLATLDVRRDVLSTLQTGRTGTTFDLTTIQRRKRRTPSAVPQGRPQTLQIWAWHDGYAWRHLIFECLSQIEIWSCRLGGDGAWPVLCSFLVALAQPSLASLLAVSSGSAPGRTMIETGRQARGQECLAYLERGGCLQRVASGICG